MIEDRQEVTEISQKMTLYFSIENWLCVENIKQAVSEFPQHTEEIQFFTLYFDVVHSAQSDKVRTVTNYLHIQIICKNIQCVQIVGFLIARNNFLHFHKISVIKFTSGCTDLFGIISNTPSLSTYLSEQ
jgi:hypothetical protein